MKFAFLFVIAALAIAGCVQQSATSTTIGTTSTTLLTTTTLPTTTTNAEAITTTTVSQAGVAARDVEYYPNAKGYYAAPSVEGDYPGVVMIHEWWGLNDGIKHAARNLAGQGYNVLAVDLYEGRVAVTSDEARNLTGSINKAVAVENMRSAVAFLKAEGSPKVASFGWCFGGGQSLQLALSGEKMDATIIYYGSLVTDEGNLSKIDWPVMGVFGSEDQSIPVDRVKAFNDTLATLEVEKEIYMYEGVGHAFANPSGANYAPEETQDAWDKTLAFLAKHLQ